VSTPIPDRDHGACHKSPHRPIRELLHPRNVAHYHRRAPTEITTCIVRMFG
jgi:hypothetical protein